MDGSVIIGTDLDTKSFDAQIEYVKEQLEEISDKLQQADMGMEVGDTLKLEAQYERLSDKLTTLVSKKEQFNNIRFDNAQKSLENIGHSVDKVGHSINRVIKKTSYWILGIFGIRSAYLFVRQAMATLSQYDEQMATNVEYIRYLLASTLKPVIEYLIDLAYKLLSYINYIAKAWFGVNLFANASTDAFRKQNKVMGGTVKKARELQKTLAGFDEMNILQKDGSVSPGGGGGGVTLPSFPDMDEVEMPWLVEWLAKHPDEVMAAIAGITGALIALKTLGLDPILSLGIGLIIAGIVYTIEKVIKYLNDPSWKNFGGVITGIGIAVAGLGIAIFGLPAIVAGVVVAILGIVISNWEKIKATLDDGIKWLEAKSEWVKSFLGEDMGAIYDNFVKILKITVSDIDSYFKTLKKVFDLFIKLVKALINGDWKSAWDYAKQILFTWGELVWVQLGNLASRIGLLFKNMAVSIGGAIRDAFRGVINHLLSEVESKINGAIDLINGLRQVINKVPGVNISKMSRLKLPRLAKGGIINMPGRGVAVGGESGPEGVIPLTDSQQMALLGEAIGRYITINANITNTMNGRVISRELQKVQNDSDFAYNR